jgi:hypothetical protein
MAYSNDGFAQVYPSHASAAGFKESYTAVKTVKVEVH